MYRHACTRFVRSAVRSLMLAEPSTQSSTQAEHLVLLQAHLRQHHTISATTYATLTSLNRSTAYLELRNFQAQSDNHIGTLPIDSRGRVQMVWID